MEETRSANNRTFELREGHVALVISHADYYALMRVVRAQAKGDAEAARLVPVLRVEGLEDRKRQ